LLGLVVILGGCGLGLAMVILVVWAIMDKMPPESAARSGTVTAGYIFERSIACWISTSFALSPTW